jgi:hypothetical protein
MSRIASCAAEVLLITLPLERKTKALPIIENVPFGAVN